MWDQVEHLKTGINSEVTFSPNGICWCVRYRSHLLAEERTIHPLKPDTISLFALMVLAYMYYMQVLVCLQPSHLPFVLIVFLHLTKKSYILILSFYMNVPHGQKHTNSSSPGTSPACRPNTCALACRPSWATCSPTSTPILLTPQPPPLPLRRPPTASLLPTLGWVYLLALASLSSGIREAWSIKFMQDLAKYRSPLASGQWHYFFVYIPSKLFVWACWPLGINKSSANAFRLNPQQPTKLRSNVGRLFIFIYFSWEWKMNLYLASYGRNNLVNF